MNTTATKEETPFVLASTIAKTVDAIAAAGTKLSKLFKQFAEEAAERYSNADKSLRAQIRQSIVARLVSRYLADGLTEADATKMAGEQASRMMRLAYPAKGVSREQVLQTIEKHGVTAAVIVARGNPAPPKKPQPETNTRTSESTGKAPEDIKTILLTYFEKYARLVGVESALNAIEEYAAEIA